MASRYGFLTQQERENEKRRAAEAETILRERRRQVSDATVQRIGPILRESLAEYFRSIGLSAADDTGKEQAALFQEEDGIKGHTWIARSMKKTGTHSEYRTDGVHVLDEHTAYTLTVCLVVDRDGQPLLHIRDYTTSKLVGGAPVAASKFSLEIPDELGRVLESKTGIRHVPLGEFLDAQDH